MTIGYVSAQKTNITDAAVLMKNTILWVVKNRKTCK